MTIKTHVLNNVATIEIARPEKKNAITMAMYQAMADALQAAQARWCCPGGADHGPAGHLHVGQRSRGLHGAAAQHGQ